MSVLTFKHAYLASDGIRSSRHSPPGLSRPIMMSRHFTMLMTDRYNLLILLFCSRSSWLSVIFGSSLLARLLSELRSIKSSDILPPQVQTCDCESGTGTGEGWLLLRILLVPAMWSQLPGGVPSGSWVHICFNASFTWLRICTEYTSHESRFFGRHVRRWVLRCNWTAIAFE